MIDFNPYPFLREIYWMERQLEVIVHLAGTEGMTTIRIEALRNIDTGRCLTRAYRQDYFTVQPTFPERHDQPVRKPDPLVEIWVPYDLPWTDQHTPEDAIEQALRYLRQRCTGQGARPAR